MLYQNKEFCIKHYDFCRMAKLDAVDLRVLATIQTMVATSSRLEEKLMEAMDRRIRDSAADTAAALREALANMQLGSRALNRSSVAGAVSSAPSKTAAEAELVRCHIVIFDVFPREDCVD